MTDLTELVLAQRELENQIDEQIDLHRAKLQKMQHDLDEVKKQIKYHESNLNLDKIALGLSIVAFGNPHGKTERLKCIEQAIDDISTGCKKLREVYLGTKNYSRWIDQGFESRYGYPPTHGNVVFTVRLKVRDRDLKPEETEAAIYCLLNAETIKHAEKV